MGPDETQAADDSLERPSGDVTATEGESAPAVDGEARSGMAMLRRVAEAAVIGVGLAFAVSEDEGPPEAVADATTEPLSATVEPIVVQVHLPKQRSTHRWGVEAVGHVAALVEVGLADLEGVVPEVVGVPRSPGVAHSLPSAASAWTLELQVDVTDADVSVEAVVCDPGKVCTRHTATGPRTAPNQAISALIGEVSQRLDRVGTSDRQLAAQPETTDSYAALLIGRSAASVLGIRDLAPPDVRGDVKRDPVARAVFLDPGSSLAWTLLGRTETDPLARVEAFTRAAELRPDSLARLADLAASLSEAGEKAAAWERWQEVTARAPGDFRFVLARAQAAVAVAEPRMARAILGELHGRYDDMPAVVEAQVSVADATTGASDALLAHWQDVDPSNPEPVRRRIRAKVDAGLREEALALTTELSHRGVGDESRALTLALASDLGRWDVASDAAASMGQDEYATRLTAAGDGQDAAARIELLAHAKAPEARLARSRALLEAGRDDDALAEVTLLLAADPWWPEALDLQSRVLTAKGDTVAAQAARERLLHADPLYFEVGR